ncbi:MAG: hypothetical protein U0514_01025 [Candidatus Andersenbacteria bacterium]
MHAVYRFFGHIYGAINGWLSGFTAGHGPRAARRVASGAGRGWLTSIRLQVWAALLIPVAGIACATHYPEEGWWIMLLTGALGIIPMVHLVVTGSLPFFFAAAVATPFAGLGPIGAVYTRAARAMSGMVWWTWFWFFTAALGRMYENPRSLMFYLGTTAAIGLAAWHWGRTTPHWLQTLTIVALFFVAIVGFVGSLGTSVAKAVVNAAIEPAAQQRIKKKASDRITKAVEGLVDPGTSPVPTRSSPVVTGSGLPNFVMENQTTAYITVTLKWQEGWVQRATTETLAPCGGDVTLSGVSDVVRLTDVSGEGGGEYFSPATYDMATGRFDYSGDLTGYGSGNGSGGAVVALQGGELTSTNIGCFTASRHAPTIKAKARGRDQNGTAPRRS